MLTGFKWLRIGSSGGPVNAVMYRRAAKKAKNLFTNLAIVSISEDCARCVSQILSKTA